VISDDIGYRLDLLEVDDQTLLVLRERFCAKIASLYE
jgi:hypothetical protein